MDHERYQELVSRFIDREIVPEEERELFAHLGSCDDCRQFLKDALVLHTDLHAGKPKTGAPPGGRFATDRLAIRAAHHPLTIRSTVPTLILLLLVTLIVGLLFSANVQGQSPQIPQAVQQTEGYR